MGVVYLSSKIYKKLISIESIHYQSIKLYNSCSLNLERGMNEYYE